MKKIIFLTPYVIPRRIDFYNKVYSVLKAQNFDPIFLIIKRKPTHRNHIDHTPLFRFEYKILQSVRFYFRRSELAIDFSVDLLPRLILLKPHTVVFEGYGFAYFPAYVYCKLVGVRTVFWNKSSSLDSVGHKRGILFRLKKALIRLHDVAVCGGTAQAKYVKYHGFKGKVLSYVDTIDTIRFKNGVTKSVSTSSPESRGAMRLLFVGDLIPRKDVNLLLTALKDLSLGYRLTVVGTGSEREALMAKARDMGGHIEFYGHAELNELYKLFADTDILVVPSQREAWGIVVEEALSAGLYVLVSAAVGAKERVHAQVNGIVFEGLDGLKSALIEASSSINLIRNNRQRRSNDFCNEVNLDISAAGFAEVVTRND